MPKKRKFQMGSKPSLAPGPKKEKTGLQFDAKTDLARFLKTSLDRRITKEDMVFQCTPILGQGFQCMLNLTCLDVTFMGDVHSEKRMAEQAAALVAMNNFGCEVSEPRPKTAAEKDINSDAKSVLCRFLQKSLSRPATKDVVAYETVLLPGQGYQARLNLPFLELSFAGEVQLDLKMAEQAAAIQALKHFGSDVSQFRLVTSNRQLAELEMLPAELLVGLQTPQVVQEVLPVGRPVGRVTPQVVQEVPQVPQEMTEILHSDPKSDLICFLQVCLNRPVTKADLEYETTSHHNGHQSKLSLCCLGLSFASETLPESEAAEQSAATKALNCLEQQT